MNIEEIYQLLPIGQEFNSRDVNRLLGDTWDTISESYSINTEEILNELRNKGKVLRSSGDHCFWYIKN